ncbi:MAG: 50S ribosomal protein L29 [candidate division WS2 bacterium]|uniref:Large ribosomal subunit protein uL29 n=1 Tax=Psychracetigena formicireducens TaxID=2986056 RepID=A0A9E2BFI8_PSYF1|nr:50S ribosomal protein L29 [Candidatus Psychracetigena formicireducens]MBT9144665.1 50S ribosomal protein L29 [Candidatus Psychracetigena formicireducens]MBT9150213.1 50S ribosomal protein L29 [Candidatus Psychracetigena formicireducens]
MKPQELRELSKDELDRRMNDLKQELFGLRFQVAVNKLKNVSRIREVRKEIARLLTIAHEKSFEVPYV